MSKSKRQVTLGVINICLSFNNTKVSISDSRGNVLCYSSSGIMNFKGAKKSTAYAASKVVEDAVNKSKLFGVKTVDIKVRGPGPQRDAAIRACYNDLVIKSIVDVTPIPYNGTRSPKKRRV